MIRDANPEDAERIAEIYNHYIHHSVITFEEVPITADDIHMRMEHVKSLGLPWIIQKYQGEIVGYAYASQWRTRSAYRFTVETTIYLDHNFSGKGLGKPLYEELLRRLPKLGIHAAIGGISLPNEQSVHLHENLGFQKVALFPEVGFKFGKWVDVGFWQLNFEGI